jgi:hypothetical protein
MNKWNFMSLVPNVAYIEITPLWPHENIDWHWIFVWMLMVNGTWIPLILLPFWKKKTSFGYCHYFTIGNYWPFYHKLLFWVILS